MKDFKKYFIIPATPEEIYRALTTDITTRLWTGDEVELNTVVGGECSLWSGSINGRFLELDPFKKIVREWYFGKQESPSIVTIKLHEHKKGTSFEVNHTNIPDEDYEDIIDGWETEYVGSLIEFYTEDSLISNKKKQSKGCALDCFFLASYLICQIKYFHFL